MTSAVRGALAFLLATLTVAAGVTFPGVANAVTVVYELEGSWGDDVPEVVNSGDMLTSTWRYNINDAEPAPQNPPQDNVTITFTAQNARFTEIPEVCEISGVDPESAIIDDGATLVCNLGIRDLGTAELLLAGVEAQGATGDKIALSAQIGEGDNQVSAELPELDLDNPFAMDMKFDGGNPRSLIEGDNQTLVFPWSLRHAPHSTAGPDSVSYTLRFTAANGETITPVAPFCGPQEYTNSGHPFSGDGQDPDRTAPFVDSCTLTQVSRNVFRLTLSGIDYSKVTLPSLDSTGTALPSDWEVVAAGSLHVQFVFDSATTISFTADPVTYTSEAGETAQDLTDNNSNSRAATRGVWTGGWTFPQMSSPRPPGTIWTDTSRTMAGQPVLAVSGVRPPQGNESQTQVCAILDNRYVTFESAQVGDISNGVVTPYEGVTYEYFTGNAIGNILNPNSDSYNPDAFRCDGSTSTAAGWTTQLPEDLATVRVIRATLPASANIQTEGSARMHVYSTVKDDVEVGQDIWHWTSYRTGPETNPRWFEPHRGTGGEKPASGTYTPDARYPYTGGGRDVMRIVAGTPQITKDVDQSVTRPGATVNFSLNYRVDAPVDTTISGVQITDTLPAGLTYVPGSASVTPSSVSGQTLTWDLPDIQTNTDYTILLSATVADDVTAGQTFTNSAQIQLGDVQDTDTALTRIRDGGYTFLTKTAEAQQVPHDSGVAEGSWIVRLTSADTGTQPFTDTIDILPYNDDGRGTEFNGTYTLNGPVEAVAGATVYYTTADPATLVDDPADPTNGSAGSIEGNSVGWTEEFIPDATAVRVIGPELAANAMQDFTINVITEGAAFEDLYVNRAWSRTGRTQLVMRTSDWFQIAAANSVSIKKYVQDADGQWRDAQNVDDYPSFHNGTTVTYRLVVTNTGDQPLTNLTLSDDRFDLTQIDPMPEGLTKDAVIEELLPGADNAVSFEYETQLSGHEAGDSVVNNACVVPEDDTVDEDCDPAGLLILPSSLAWEKVSGVDPDVYLDGSEWELVQVDEEHNPIAEPMEITDCVADDASECTGLDQNPQAGQFFIDELPDGLYRLTETRAPAGYVLDAEPRYITVEGVTELSDPIVNEQHDAPTIPLTGGIGTASFLTAAGLATGLALLLMALRRKSRRSTELTQ